MKTKLLLLCILSMVAIATYAQKINYEKTYSHAQALSAKTGKPMMILVNIIPPPGPGSDKYLISLNDKSVVELFNTNFVNYTVLRTDTAANKIIRKYSLTTFPSFVFVDAQGGLLHKDFGNSPFAKKFIDMGNTAIARSKDKSLAQYDQEYAAGKLDSAGLRNYITRRKQAGIYDNARQIDTYVNYLKIRDFDSYEMVLFILEAAPYLDSKAYKLAYTNRKITDSIYKKEPITKRKEINSRMIGNTMARAIATKNIQQAHAVANFTRGSWAPDYKTGQQQYELKIVQYYAGVKDTANYFRQASGYYDRYYMNIGVDSIKKLENKRVQDLRVYDARPDTTYRIVDGKEQKVITRTEHRPDPNSSFFATELNNVAYQFYQTGTRNVNHLTKAMIWSKRSIEISPVPNPAYYDTLAHLLYRLNFHSEAEKTQEEAVALARKNNRDVRLYTDNLAKIKQKSL